MINKIHYALLVATAALLPTYLVRFSVWGIPTNLLEVFITAAFLTGCLSPAVRQRWREQSKQLPKTILVAIVVFLLSAIVSTVISPHPLTSLGILKGWIIFPLLLGGMVYASGKETKNKIIRAIILSGVVVSLLGISQLGAMERIKSIYDVPNSLALFIAPLIVISAWQGFITSRSKLFTYFTVVMFVALLLTQSLAGLIVVIITLLLGLLIFSRRPVSSNYNLLILAIVIVFLAVPFVSKKVNYLIHPDSSAAVRMQLWSISTELIKEKPILGIGLGTFEPAYQTALHHRFSQSDKYSPRPLPEFVFRDSHNWILSFWLNTGLFGFLSFTVINVWFFWSRYRRLQTTHYSLQAIPLAVFSILIFGLVDTIYWKNDLSALYWILIALII